MIIKLGDYFLPNNLSTKGATKDISKAGIFNIESTSEQTGTFYLKNNDNSFLCWTEDQINVINQKNDYNPFDTGIFGYYREDINHISLNKVLCRVQNNTHSLQIRCPFIEFWLSFLIDKTDIHLKLNPNLNEYSLVEFLDSSNISTNETCPINGYVRVFGSIVKYYDSDDKLVKVVDDGNYKELYDNGGNLYNVNNDL